MSGIIIRDRTALTNALAQAGRDHHVYILRRPDDQTTWGVIGTPFYVGIGKGDRLFAHEKEAEDSTRNNAKVTAIRSIWSQGLDVVYEIDSFHDDVPWHREEELINSLGRLVDGDGPLTNAQVYAPSAVLGEVELRKYASDHEAGDADAIPDRFKLLNTRLMAGPAKPRSHGTVHGKIYDVAEANPGVTGERLLRLCQQLDFKANKSAYTQSGRACAAWLVGYIESAFFRSDRCHLQNFSDDRTGRKARL